MNLHYFTTNKSKIEEANNNLRNYGITVKQVNLPIFEIKSNNMHEIVREKVKQAFAVLKAPILADDVGVFFDAYNNFPGDSPKKIFQGIGYSGIMRLLKNKKRTAKFVITLGYLDKQLKEPIFFTGTCFGRLAEKPCTRKNSNFPFDSIFIPRGSKKTMIELNVEERKKFSCRTKALKKLITYMRNYEK
jgi:XTP/dITP diphosphohydrolase